MTQIIYGKQPAAQVLLTVTLEVKLLEAER